MKNQAAVKLGRRGGLAKSPRKANSSRRNGSQGGRPCLLGVTDWNRFFNAVDEVRRGKVFEPLEKLAQISRRPLERSLIVATARALSRELKTAPPPWASKPLVLKKPYFVSGFENLKASALLESPLSFRESHIFVLSNFLSRA